MCCPEKELVDDSAEFGVASTFSVELKLGDIDNAK